MKIGNKQPLDTINQLVDTSYQRKLLHYFILLTVAVVIGQTVFYLYVGATWLAFINCIILGALWLSMWVLNKSSYHLASSLVVFLCLLIILSSIINTGLGNNTIFWFFVFPIVATMFKGKHGGSLWLLILILTLLAIFLGIQAGFIDALTIAYDAGTFQQLIMSVSIVALFIYFYQNSIDVRAQDLEEKEVKLTEIYTQLQDEIRKHDEARASLKNGLRKLARQEAQEAALLESIGEGVIAIDADERIIMVNLTVENALGRDKKELLGKPYGEVFQFYDDNDEPVPVEQTPLIQTLRQRSPRRHHEFYYHDQNGEPVPIAITAAPIELGGEHVGAVEVFRDISEERAIARAKDEFVSLASHQLRTPLSAINWYAERLLKTAGLKGKDKGYLETIYEDSTRMSGLLSDYLNVSRLELKTEAIEAQDIDPGQMAKSIINDLKPIIKDKQLDVSYELTEGVSVYTDKHLLEMILQNLISNAAKYTPEKGRIVIRTKSYDGKTTALKGSLIFEVEDTGIGIPPEEQSKLFTKLFRARNVLTQDIEGTGLGLYTAKAAIDRLDGEIWFESQVGEGTRFSVAIPDAKDDIITGKDTDKKG